MDNKQERTPEQALQQAGSKVTFYYLNKNDKVVALNEDVAIEQHDLHKEYLGNSEDLEQLSFTVEGAIGNFLKSHEKEINKRPPKDKRRVVYVKGKPIYGGVSQLSGQDKQGGNRVEALEQQVKQLTQAINQQQNGTKNSKVSSSPGKKKGQPEQDRQSSQGSGELQQSKKAGQKDGDKGGQGDDLLQDDARVSKKTKKGKGQDGESKKDS